MVESAGTTPRSSPSALPTRFKRSALSSYGLTAVLMAVALITTPILTRHLGIQRFGIWIFVGSTIANLQLLDLGLGGAIVSSIARLSAADEQEALERTLNSSFFVLLGLGLVALAVTAVAAQFLPEAIHLSGSLVGTTRNLMLLLGLDMAVSIPMDTFGCGLIALQRFDLVNLTLMTVAISQAIAWTVVLLSGGGLLLLGVVTVSISLVGQFVRFLLLRHLLPNLSISPSRVDRKLIRSLASPAAWYSLGDLIEGFRDYASVLVLGLVRNVSTAGIFAVGEKLASLGTKLGTPLTEPLFAHSAALAGGGEGGKLGDVAHTGSRLTAGATLPCCLVVAIFARPALIAWVGPGYQRATPAVVILAVAFGLRSLNAAPSKVVSGSGGQKLIAVTSLGEVAFQIVLTAVLGTYLGVTGVALAILSSVICIELAVTLPLLSRRLHTGVVDLVVPVVRAHVPATAIALSSGWFLSQDPVMSFVNSHGRIVSVGVVVGAGLAVLLTYFGVFALTGLDRDTRLQAISWLRGHTVGFRSIPRRLRSRSSRQDGG